MKRSFLDSCKDILPRTCYKKGRNCYNSFKFASLFLAPGQKVPEQGGALRLQDVPHDFGVVAEVLLKEVQDGAAGPKARVFGPIVDLRDPGGDDPPAHMGQGSRVT